MDDEALAGGNMNDAVVRVGDTVRRAAQPWSPTVQRLLAHVRATGLDWVPEPLGFDELGREVLSFLPGHVAHDLPEWLRAERTLVDAANALGAWHAATMTFATSAEDTWWSPAREPVEVICHNDFAPYNHVFRDGVFGGCIDFDTCYPGPRMWDACYTAYRYVPLTPEVGEAVADGDEFDRSPFPRAEQLARLRTFLAAYASAAGVPVPTPAELLAMLPARLQLIAAWCDERGTAELAANAVMYRAHADWIEGGAFAS